MKYNVRTTNFKSSVYKTSYKTNFITHWCKTMKLCKQPDWCFLSINWCWKTVSFIFDKNIKKWQKFIAFFSNSKFYIFIATVKELKKKILHPCYFQTYKKYHQHNVYIWEPFLCQILATISFRDSPWTDWQGENLREITLIPCQLDRKSYHWKCNGYLM